MGVVTIADVRACSPLGEFNAVADAFIQAAIDDAYSTHEETSWFVNHWDLAIKNFAAHTLALRLGGTNSVAGPVTAQSADGISQSFGAAASSVSTGIAWYQKTVWGQEYLRLLRIQANTPFAGCQAGAALFTCQ